MRAVRPDRASWAPSVGLIRYLASDALRSQRWVAPTLVYGAVVVISNANRASLLSTYAGTATFLLFVSTWLSFLTLGSEDPVQATITVTTVGSDSAVYVAKLAVSWAGSLLLAIGAVAWPLIVQSYSPPLRPAVVLEGLGAHLAMSLFGVALAAVAERLVRRLGWVVLLCCGVGMVEIFIPHVPPARQVLVAFDADHPHAIASSLTFTAIETIALCGLLSAGAFFIPRRFR